jgi:DNA-binding NarL/FixJ family response regulator
MEPLRIVLADDHPVVRQGLRSLLELQPGWRVAGEAANGKEAVKKVLETKPDVTILDIQMPLLNGLEAAREIIKSGSKTRILILTIHESDVVIREVLDAGARGYVLKSDAARDLVAAVEALQHNKTFFTSKVAEMVLDGYLKKVKNPTETEPAASRITPRQREILKLFAEGKTSKEVAVALGMSIRTVETHRSNILQRLNCHSLSELVRYALRNRLIDP